MLDSKVPPFQLSGGLNYSSADIKAKVGEAVKGLKEKIVSLVPNPSLALGKRTNLARDN